MAWSDTINATGYSERQLAEDLSTALNIDPRDDDAESEELPPMQELQELIRMLFFPACIDVSEDCLMVYATQPGEDLLSIMAKVQHVLVSK